MKTSPTFGLIAAVAMSLVIAGCYTQFESTQEDQPPDDITYSESDSLEGGTALTEGYDDARYRFYVNAGYPYWSPGFSIGFWDPYPFDPWLLWSAGILVSVRRLLFSWLVLSPGGVLSPGILVRTAGDSVSWWVCRVHEQDIRSGARVRFDADRRRRISHLVFQRGREIRVHRGTSSCGHEARLAQRRSRRWMGGRPRGRETRIGQRRHRPQCGKATPGNGAHRPRFGPRPSKGRGRAPGRANRPPRSVRPKRKAGDSSVRPRSNDSGGSRSYSPPPSSAPAYRTFGAIARQRLVEWGIKRPAVRRTPLTADLNLLTSSEKTMRAYTLRLLMPLGIATLLFSGAALSQFPEDALRLSMPGIGVGTRALGMGTAYAGVASDYSAIYWNPAGLAQLKYGEFMGAFTFPSVTDEGTFFGTTTSTTASGAHLGALGFAAPFPVKRGSFVVALGFHRDNSFVNGLGYEGFNPSYSYIQNSAPDGQPYGYRSHRQSGVSTVPG